MKVLADIIASYIAAAIVVGVGLGLVCFVMWRQPDPVVWRVFGAAVFLYGTYLIDPKKW